MKTDNEHGQDIFVTGTSISDGGSWYDSLIRQVRQLQDERRNPRKPLELTAEKDMTALDKLVEQPSAAISVFHEIREYIDGIRHPHQIVMSATPVEVDEIWSKQKSGVPGMLSLTVHALVLILAIIPWAASLGKLPAQSSTNVMLIQPDRLILNLPAKDDSGGGGGGGKHQLTPPSLGRLPKAADRQFVPPDPEPPKNPDPTLVMESTIVAPQLSQLPSLNLLSIGAPDGAIGPPSSGPGNGGGIGTGNGRGVGIGSGPGVGDGEGGGYGGGIFRVGGGVTAPSILKRVEPMYSEEARKARYQGTVVLEAVVLADGTVRVQRVVKGIGFGLDEKAIEALRQWKFIPGKKNGEAVAVQLQFEVNFTLR